MAKPEIRLKGFEGEWEDVCFRDITYLAGTKNRDNLPLPSYSITNENGFVPQNEQFENGGTMANADKRMYYIVIPDTFAYNPARINVGSIGYDDLDKDVIVSSLYVIFKTDCKTNNYFLDKWFKTPHFKKLINLYQEGGVRLYFFYDKLCQCHLFRPELKEQQSIANYFKSLDSMIQGVTKKIASLKQMKQACLVSMFPQGGETTPRVRFKGFKGEWEIVKLSSIATRVTRKNSHLESTLPLTISAAEGLIEQTAFFNNVVASSNVSGYYLVKRGEFAYNKSYSNGYPFGAVKRLDKYDMGVLSTLYIVFSVDKAVCSDYIVHFFDTSLWHQEVAKRAAEGARNHGLLNIGAEDFLDIDIVLPKSKEEQQKIASYFTSLDKQISLQEARLEKLKHIKSACLDKMFV